MPATRQPLSVAIITLNAASQLEACLQSVRFADERVTPKPQAVIENAPKSPSTAAFRFPHKSNDSVHEKVETKTNIGQLNADLLHDSAESLAAYLTKQNRYSQPLRFIKFYLVRQGLRDGLPGLIHTAIGCFNSFMKYSKMLERQKSDAVLR